MSCYIRGRGGAAKKCVKVFANKRKSVIFAGNYRKYPL